MNKIRAFVAAIVVATSCFAAGCAAEVSEPGGAGTEQGSPAATSPAAPAAEHVGESADPLVKSCYTSCIQSDPNDPYITSNCHCICYGKPGKTCWLM